MRGGRQRAGIRHHRDGVGAAVDPLVFGGAPVPTDPSDGGEATGSVIASVAVFPGSFVSAEGLGAAWVGTLDSPVPSAHARPEPNVANVAARKIAAGSLLIMVHPFVSLDASCQSRIVTAVLRPLGLVSNRRAGAHLAARLTSPRQRSVTVDGAKLLNCGADQGFLLGATNGLVSVGARFFV